MYYAILKRRVLFLEKMESEIEPIFLFLVFVFHFFGQKIVLKKHFSLLVKAKL